MWRIIAAFSDIVAIPRSAYYHSTVSLAIRLLRLSLLVGLILLGFLACQGRPDGESGGGVADSGNGSAETDTTNGGNEGAPGPSPERAAQPEEPAKPTVSRFVPLAEVEIDTSAADQPPGTAYEVPIPVLRDVLQEDSSVTLILCVLSQDGHGPNLSLAASDNPEIAGPELIVPLVQP